MPQVLMRIESSMIEASIQSTSGRNFWCQNFGSVGEVSFNKTTYY